MTFVSLSWLEWMVATTLVFWATPARFRLHVLAAATFAFLAMNDWQSCGVLVALTGLTHLLTRGRSLSGKRTALAVLPIAGVLLVYKILSAGADDDLITDTLIPLGLSYYTLRCIHYALERYKGRIEERPLHDLVTYLFFLPTIFIGPIHRYPEFDRDRRRHRWDAALFSAGLERILYGYVKIVFLGNFLVSQVLAEWSARLTEEGTAFALYLEMVRIGFNLYIQFSGHSDIAIGFARLLGFRVMENFNWPLFQKNISDFWRCWHISLTSWCREYVYASVFAHTRSPALGALATLVAVGLWHEVSLRYLAWGCYHGLGIIIWQQSQRLRYLVPPVEARALRWCLNGLSRLLTLHFVLLGFLLVRQPDFGAMVETLQTLLAWRT
jgi:alginate O-acetyltransferase complex protein AlgI